MMSDSGITRRKLFQASLAAMAGFKSLVGNSLRADAIGEPTPGAAATPRSTQIYSEENSERTVFSNGVVSVICHKRSGLADFLWNGNRKVTNVSSSIKLNGVVKTSDYAQHLYDKSPVPVEDTIGKGLRFTMVHASENRPDLLQRFTLYEARPFCVVQAEMRGPRRLSTNYFAPVVVEPPGAIDIGKARQNRALRVPFDNDVWVRYEAVDITRSGAAVSAEVTAVYDNESRNGLIFGSVTHDKWKTGVKFRASNGGLNELEVFGGLALETYSPPAAALSSTSGSKALTRDSLPHGEVSGDRITSPAVFVGFYEDWRDGLEEFGRANAAYKPPHAWKSGIPFGWNSFAALAGRLDYTRYLGAIDFINQKLAPNGFNSDRVVYPNLDGGWQRLDASQLRDALDFINNLGRSTGIDYRPGIYMAPFAYFGPRPRPGAQAPDVLDNFVEGTATKYRYRDILLKRPDGTPLPTLDGAHPLDPTHPGTKARIRSYIRTFKQLGYQYLKIDFLTHAALEGVRWDKSVETGIQAYNHGMQFILDEVADEMFLSLSIAPIFPGGYGHARRISCDTMGHISLAPDAYPQQSTEYMLNSLTYGWWTSPSLYIADADQIPLGTGAAIHGARTVNEGRSRLLSAVIAGSQILDSSNYFDDPTAREMAPLVYTNARVNALAGGKPFRPVEGNTGDRAADAFVREENGSCYLAVFNFDFDKGTSKKITLDRLSKSFAGSGISVTDVWTNASLGRSTGTLSISLGPAESKLLKLEA